jgi:uncharacterized protein YaiI (UPF0178 family)
VTLYVDADACPVKAEAVRVAERRRTPVKIVSNGGIRPDPHPLVETVIVADGPDAADDWIAERIGPGDICVTGDVPLAHRCVTAGAVALRHDGHLWTRTNIGDALAMRDLMTDLRAANPLSQGGGGKPFTKADRSRFLEALERELRKAARPG